MEALRGMNLPPGFGFHPSDTELVSHYLKRKILGHKIEYDLIPEVDIYKHEPWDLPAKCNLPIEDNKWHFFASRDRKYPTGSRSNRATVAGYWKSTGKDRAIKLNKRTLGTKKTLVFHEGRPPSGRRTEWIMHEYYLDEHECQGSPDRKDAFVLCRVTKRNDWGLENDNEVCDRNPHQQQLNDGATSVASSVKPEDVAASVICVEEPNHVATSVVSPEPSSDVAMPAITANASSLNDDNELQEWLEELFDPSFNPVADNGSANLSVTEQYAESSNSQNPGSVAPKIESEYASPIEDGIDVRDLLTDDFNLSEDLHSMWYTATDDFHSSMLLEQAGQADIAFDTNQAYSMMGMDHFTLPLDQENDNPNLSNGNIDTGVVVLRRNAPASAAKSSAPASGAKPFARNVRMQLGIKRMVTSNSESINQTITFAGNSGRLNSMTRVEHRKKHADDATTSVKQSDALKPSGSQSNHGYLRGITNALRCSSAGFNVYIFFAVFVILAAVLTTLLHGYRHSGTSSS